MRPTSGTAYHGGTSAALAPGVRATRRKDRHDPPSPRDAGLVVGYLVLLPAGRRPGGLPVRVADRNRSAGLSRGGT